MTCINISKSLKFFTISRIFSIILYLRNRIAIIVCDTIDISISNIYVYVSVLGSDGEINAANTYATSRASITQLRVPRVR